jgi:tetratricopeptide (TPR) repeat protein
VWRLFGRQCLSCASGEGVRARHVKPPQKFPQLALDPCNGVPLCGDCFDKIRRGEIKYVHDLRRCQPLLAQGKTPHSIGVNEPSEEELWQRAESNPADGEAVEACFARSANAAKVIEFYNGHHQAFRKTPAMFWFLAHHLMEAQRFEDVAAVVDGVARCAERRGEAAGWAYLLAWQRSLALYCLARKAEAIKVVEDAASRFPDDAGLHRMLSLKMASATGWQTASDECVEHALKAVELCPDDFFTRLHAATVLRLAEKYPAALEMAEHAEQTAATDTERCQAWHVLGQIYAADGLYDEALERLQKILDQDAENVDAMAEMANCCYMLDRRNDARKYARECLMLAPENKMSQHILHLCGEEKR